MGKQICAFVSLAGFYQPAVCVDCLGEGAVHIAGPLWVLRRFLPPPQTLFVVSADRRVALTFCGFFGVPLAQSHVARILRHRYKDPVSPGRGLSRADFGLEHRTLERGCVEHSHAHN